MEANRKKSAIHKLRFNQVQKDRTRSHRARYLLVIGRKKILTGSDDIHDDAIPGEQDNEHDPYTDEAGDGQEKDSGKRDVVTP